MKRKKRRLTFGKVQGPDFQPQDIRCPFCHGNGTTEHRIMSARDKVYCIACQGTGKREVFAARLLSGEIQLDELGRPFEPHDPKNLKEVWSF